MSGQALGFGSGRHRADRRAAARSWAAPDGLPDRSLGSAGAGPRSSVGCRDRPAAARVPAGRRPAAGPGDDLPHGDHPGRSGCVACADAGGRGDHLRSGCRPAPSRGVHALRLDHRSARGTTGLCAGNMRWRAVRSRCPSAPASPCTDCARSARETDRRTPGTIAATLDVRQPLIRRVELTAGAVGQRLDLVGLQPAT